MVTNRNSVDKASRDTRIALPAGDYARLSALARAAWTRTPALASGLADELDRADILAEDGRSERVVCMNCETEFRDETTGKVQKVTLVYPEDADISKRRVSVLTPIGTALIGLREGDTMTWETPGGETRHLTVIAARGPETIQVRSQAASV
jgi:regulator of nucleoside diphosphate kinase